MAADLARHDALLTAACEAWDGQVFSHTGDGLGAVFPTAGAAVGAAMAGHWPSPTRNGSRPSPQVRMAVHAGEAVRRAGNYFGPPLNRTARLLATASGGQILCSEAAADLAGDRLPPGTVLVDLGEHRLADLALPERVFQVAQAQLPSSSRRCGPRTHRHNLPAP